jgi:hypothetical protein
MSVQVHTPAALSLWENLRYLLGRMLGGPQNLSELRREQNTLETLPYREYNSNPFCPEGSKKK